MKEETKAFLRVEKGRVEGHKASEEIHLSTDVIVIGRPPSSGDRDVEIPDIKIRDDYVSRSHVKIYFSYEERCFVMRERDTGSKNGTFINDEQIGSGKPYPLKDGDLIGLAKIGRDFRVVFRFRESEGTLDTLSRFTETGESLEKGLIVDLEARRLWVHGKEVPLRRKEFDLLAFLYQNHGKACSKDEIANKVWGDVGGIVSQETIDTNIYRIREVIEADSSKPQYIITLPRYGYRLDL